MDTTDRPNRQDATATDRACPWCGGTEVRFVSRGYAGVTDANDQYFVCGSCQRTTYEMMSKTAREMRLGRYKAGDTYQDRANRTRYQINRVLKVGANEFLLYLKPVDVNESLVSERG